MIEEKTRVPKVFGPETASHLYRAIRRLPKPARQFAYNLIDQMENGILSRPPLGNHPLQRPQVKVRLQLDALERALTK